MDSTFEISPGDEVFMIRNPSIIGKVNSVVFERGSGKARLVIEVRGGYKLTTAADKWWPLPKEKKDEAHI